MTKQKRGPKLMQMKEKQRERTIVPEPPQDPAVERLVIAMCLTDMIAWRYFRAALKEEFFYSTANRKIFEMLMEDFGVKRQQAQKQLRNLSKDLRGYAEELIACDLEKEFMSASPKLEVVARIMRKTLTLPRRLKAPIRCYHLVSFLISLFVKREIISLCAVITHDLFFIDHALAKGLVLFGMDEFERLNNRRKRFLREAGMEEA